MKKTKMLVAIMLACLLSFTFVLAACDQGVSQDPEVVAARNAAKEELIGYYEALVENTQYSAGERALLDRLFTDALLQIDVTNKVEAIAALKDDAIASFTGKVAGDAVYTYNTYTTSFASSWNMLDYETADQSDMFGYAVSSFYEFDYLLDDEGEIVDGAFEIKPVMASGKPIDLTTEYAGQFAVPENATSGMVWKIPVRTDLKWDDGTEIKPSDFVWTLQQQLSPEYLFHRADSYYTGTTVIHNAENYFKQGSRVWEDNGVTGKYSAISDFVKNEDGVYTTEETGEIVKIAVNQPLDWLSGNSLAAYVYTYGSAMFDDVSFWELYNNHQIEGDKGFVALTDETLALLQSTISHPAWGEGPEYFVNYLYTYNEYPEMDFEEVGIWAVNAGDDEEHPEDNYIVVVLDKPIQWGESGYNFAYSSIGGLPLVKQDVFEQTLTENDDGTWTSTYASSVNTSPSYGPYKLTVFESGKQYIFEKNENWFGYGLEEYEGQYQTSRIVCNYIAEYETAFMAFLKGEISAIGLNSEKAIDYKASEQAYFTPSDYVGSLQVQSLEEELVDPDDGNAKELLLNVKFRQAISLAFNREEYTSTLTASSKPGLGLFGPIHYYDVENGKTYRSADVTKRVLLDVYGVDESQYPSLDDAVDATTGYNLQLAKKLVAEAIAEELEAGTIKDTDKLQLIYGTVGDNVEQRKVYNYFKDSVLVPMLEGTMFEGDKFILDYDGTNTSQNFATNFTAGKYHFLMAGWQGMAWNPYGFMMAYLDSNYRYALGWDPDAEPVTVSGLEFNFAAGEDAEPVHEMTLTASQWYACLNSVSGAFNMTEGYATTNDRLAVVAALEAHVLKSYFSIPINYSYSAALRSYKVQAVGDSYHTFMGWGGVQYYTYNYNDAEWALFIKQNGGQIDYQK